MMAAPNWAATVGKPLMNADSSAIGGIIDAEFETITRGTAPAAQKSAKSDTMPVNAAISDNLSLLRSDSTGEKASNHPDNLTPAFMVFTLLAAFVVFWVSGGHVLLY